MSYYNSGSKAGFVFLALLVLIVVAVVVAIVWLNPELLGLDKTTEPALMISVFGIS